jgi:hypothetical protein
VKELYVFCEGRTEQNFCSQVLQPHLFPQHDGIIHTIQIANSRQHGVIHRGGVRRYSALRTDIRNALKQHRRGGVFFTSMIDLYGLPRNFPGMADQQRNPDNPRPYVDALEKAFGNDIDDPRFVPHLQLHEYETLLFANVESFRGSFNDCERQIGQLQDVADAFETIEHINDGPQTAPSIRIIKILPAYMGLKATAGPDIAERTGIQCLRESSPHFGDWLTTLENRLA